jgi:hypothetical protein
MAYVFDWMHHNSPTLPCWKKENQYNPVLKKKYKYAGKHEVKIVFEPIFVAANRF